jgi:aspartate/methionine/tyrosine aminotransferase
MVKQEPFLLEQFADTHEYDADYTLAETCCASVSLNDLEEITGEKIDLDKLLNKKLGYGWITGSDELKTEISNLYETIKNENIVITNGGIGANFLSFYSLIEPGDHAIVVDPIYQQLNSLPKLFGAEVDKWYLKEENNWQPDLKDLENLIKPNTKIIILSSPNNPTGAFISIEDIEKIIEIAKKNDIFILSDEVYRPLFHSTPKDLIPKSIADLYDKGISTGSMSKAFALAGLRLGWIACKYMPFINDCFVKRDYNTISVTPINDIISQYALSNKEKLLQRNSNICSENLEILKDAIERSNGKLDVFIPTAGTTCFIKVIGVENTEQLCLDLIKDYKTLFIPGETFGYPGYLRAGFGSSKKDIIACMENLLKYLESK